MRNEKICVYTCITGDYDELQPVYQEEGIDYICFTNNRNLKSAEWKIIYIEDNNNLGNMLLSREIKIIGHPFLKEKYDISIWIDGSVQVRNSIKDFLKQYCETDKFNMACFKHSVRDCVYEEAVACIVGRKEDKENLLPVLEMLREEKYPAHYGLAECTVLIRRHNNVLVKQAMQLWFELLKKYAKRDQLYFPYVIRNMELNIQWIDMNVFDNPWFFRKSHRELKDITSCRILFGKCRDVESCVYQDYMIKESDSGCRLQFLMPLECEDILINLGTHFGRMIYNFSIVASEVTEITYSGLSVLQYHVFDNEDMVIRIAGKFSLGQKIELSFNLTRTEDFLDQKFLDAIIDSYYYDKRTFNNSIRIMGQQNQKMSYEYNKINQKYSEVREKCSELEDRLKPYEEIRVSPLFDKVRPLCERQDLATKVIRKVILKRY